MRYGFGASEAAGTRAGARDKKEERPGQDLREQVSQRRNIYRIEWGIVVKCNVSPPLPAGRRKLFWLEADHADGKRFDNRLAHFAHWRRRFLPIVVAIERLP